MRIDPPPALRLLNECCEHAAVHGLRLQLVELTFASNSEHGALIIDHERMSR